MADLTPEEKEKIFLEEKVRHEAREQLEKKSKQNVGCLGCRGVFGMILLGSILLAIIIGTFGKNSSLKPDIQHPSENATNWQKEEAKQAKRKVLIQQLLNRGVFQKVEYRERGATIIVDSNFYLLNFEDKNSFVNVVYAYLSTRAKSEYVVVTLKDALSNNKVGECSVNGLKMK